MVDEGLFDRFPCDAVFALHNEPNLPFGQFALREGPIMAAVDEARITVHGRGGHGAEPQATADPIVWAPASSWRCRPSSHATSTRWTPPS